MLTNEHAMAAVVHKVACQFIAVSVKLARPVLEAVEAEDLIIITVAVILSTGAMPLVIGPFSLIPVVVSSSAILL